MLNMRAIGMCGWSMPIKRFCLVHPPRTTTRSILRLLSSASGRTTTPPLRPTARYIVSRQRTPSGSNRLTHKRPFSSSRSNLEEDQESLLLYGTLLVRGIMAVGMVHCFTEYCAEITLCEGPSMHPTLHPYGEIVLIDKLTIRRLHNHSNPQESDSLCCGRVRVQQAMERQAAHEKQDPSNVDEWHEQRISVSDLEQQQSSSRFFSWSLLWELLTTPLSVGDVVVLQHPTRSRGTVCKRVLGLPGDTVLRPRQRQGLLVVPDGHMWVEGDNPNNSSDSRNYGPVPMALLQGRVLCRLWPFRGHAVMARGAPPRHLHGAAGFTVLPAGYEGQHIVKSLVRATQKEDEKTSSSPEPEIKTTRATKRSSWSD